MQESQNPKKQNNNKWLVFINIPIQMGIIILIGVFLGIWLDEKFHREIFTIVFSLLSVFLALYVVIRQVKNLNDDSKDKL